MTRTDNTEPAEQPGTVADRFASLSVANGDVVVFDTEDPDRWIQSDAAVELEEAR